MDGELKSVRFRREREQSWRRLEALLTQVERRGAHRLTIDEAIDLPVLYRSCLSSLSVARAVSADRGLLSYLEALAVRAYLIVHSRRFRILPALGRFYAVTLPRAMRAEGWLIGLAALVLAATTLAGYQLVRADPAYFNAIVDPGLAGDRTPAATTETLRRTLYDQPPALEALAMFAAILFSHNSMLAVLTFAVGFALMVPTLLLVAVNGLTIGAMVALFVERGLGIDMLAWLSIHGTTELLALVLAAAGGLVIGRAILFPGQLQRVHALREQGGRATALALGAVSLLVIAALLEGFGRQLVTTVEWRLGIGTGFAVLYVGYVLLCGRGDDDGRDL